MTKLEQMLAEDGVFVGAHRGFSSRYPENTLLAVKEGLDLGVDMVEVDVYLSRDHVPVVAHDYHLERCSNGTGVVSDHTLNELKQLDFGIHRGAEFEGLRLPTLEQFLDMMRAYPDAMMDIDIKPAPNDLEAAQAVMDEVERSGMLDRAVFNSIDCDVVDCVYERCGKRTIGAPPSFPWIRNFKPGPQGTLSRLWGICIPLNELNQENVRMLRDRGIAIVCTPCDTEKAVDLAMSLDVTLPLCDDPRAYLRRLGK